MSLTIMLQKRLQSVQYAVASFVTGHYVKSMKGILKLGWLPIEQRRDCDFLKQIFKPLHSDTWPDYLQLNVRRNKRELRSDSTISLEIPRESGTFKIMRPDIIRNYSNYKTFLSLSNKLLIDSAEQRN